MRLYGGIRAVARRIGVPPWTVRRWCRLSSADTLTVGTLNQLTSAFPELQQLLYKEPTQ